MKRLVIAAVAAATAAVVFAAPVQARQEKTVASAQQFIRQMMTRGDQTFRVVSSDGYYTAGNAVITSVNGYDCSTTIYGEDRNGRTLSRRINWRKISDIEDFGDGQIGVFGPIELTDGDTFSELALDVANPAEATRVAAAMEFIRSKCDPTAGGVW